MPVVLAHSRLVSQLVATQLSRWDQQEWTLTCQLLLDVQWKLYSFPSKKASNGSEHCPQEQEN
jgi:hypothetical protein